MNYYEHHLGDYAEATAHLSFVEDAAYSRLMRKTYASEAPLPSDIAATQRLIGARTREERAAVEAVLREFFSLHEDGWHNARCDAEIARYQDKQRKAKASAEASWAARRAMPAHSERNANADQTHMQTDSERNADAMRTQCDGNAPRARSSPQSPVSSPQSPGNTGETREAQGSRKADPPQAAVAAPPPKPPRIACPEGVDTAVWADWLTLRRAKRAPVTATVVDGARTEAAKAGMPLEAFLRVWCRRGSQGLEAAWLKPDERASAGIGRQAPALDTAARNAESRRLLGFAPSPPTGEIVDA